MRRRKGTKKTNVAISGKIATPFHPSTVRENTSSSPYEQHKISINFPVLKQGSEEVDKK